MKRKIILLSLLLGSSVALFGQEQNPGFNQVSNDIKARLEGSLEELSKLQSNIAAEKNPLNTELADLETQLAEARNAYKKIARKRDGNILDLSTLRKEIKSRQDESIYLSNLLSEYVRNFDAGLHIAERPLYADALEQAKLAPDNANLSDLEIFRSQAALLDTSFLRLNAALGGDRFEGSAVDAGGRVRRGAFLLVGPTALFSSADGTTVGTVAERLGSLEPTVLPFANPEDANAASNLIEASAGLFPFDPTLGNAHKIEATNETLIEHIKKGGPVMIPILAMAAIALIIALYKWISLTLLPMPSKKKIEALYESIHQGDRKAAQERVRKMPGPMGEMLAAGVEHLREPRELIEEVMYEIVLKTRQRTQNLLPFISICAASAPLLGLLGTVTGIINTFKMITVFGSGDVKSLSGGISEALITTKFGLIVAIPALLLHAFLARKARGVVAKMEGAGLGLVNHISIGKAAEQAAIPEAFVGVQAAPDPEIVKDQVNEILGDLLGAISVDQNLANVAASKAD